MLEFEPLGGSLYHLKVPFADNFTSVFLKNTERTVLIDCASNAGDVDSYVKPALDKLGVTPEVLLISHDHGDHSGGLTRLRELYPKLTVAMLKPREGCTELHEGDDYSGLRVLTLPGHTADSAGFWDVESDTLLTCDCLQEAGIALWGCSLNCREGYFKTIDRIRTLNPSRIVTSHAYYPLGLEARGEWVTRMLDSCESIARETLDFTAERKGQSYDEIARAFAESHPGWPKLAGNML